MEEMKVNHSCLLCSHLTKPTWRIKKDINLTLSRVFRKENLTLFNFYLCSECHTRVLEAKEILALLNRLENRLEVITTTLKKLTTENPAITSDVVKARSALLGVGVGVVYNENDKESCSGSYDEALILKDPLSLEGEGYSNHDNDNYDDDDTRSGGSDCKGFTTNVLEGSVSFVDDNDHDGDKNSLCENEEFDNSCNKSKRFRSQNFSDAESIVLWKEYSKRRRKSENGKLPFRVWSKIARNVSKVDEVKRTPAQCQKKVQILQSTFNKETLNGDMEQPVCPAWLKSEEAVEDSTGETESDFDPEEISEVLPKVKRERDKNFSPSEIRSLWSEYMRRESEIDGAPWNVTTKIWKEIVKIHASRCNVNRTWKQCRTKVTNLLYKERYLKYGLSRTEDQDDVKYLPQADVYTIPTQNGPVELKMEVLKLQKCDDVLLLGRSPILLNHRIEKLRERLLRKDLHEEKSDSTTGNTLKRRNDSNIMYECSECLKKFKTQGRFEFHSKRTHQTQAVRYNCISTNCTFNFNSLVDRERHIKREHPEIEPGFSCETEGCSNWRKYYTKEALKSHTDREHDESSKNFVCEFCAKKFFTVARLNKHCKITHQEAGFTCEYCSKAYKTKATLLGHQTQIHGSLDPQKFKPELLTCKMCGYIAPLRQTLNRHMKIHTKNFKLKCNVPGCNFG